MKTLKVRKQGLLRLLLKQPFIVILRLKAKNERDGGIVESIEKIELEQGAVFQIGDVKVIATAHYNEDGADCFDKISSILREEVQRGLDTG